MANDERTSTEQDRRLSQVLGAYYEAEREGRAPSREELCRLHPDLAEELAGYFADEEHFDRLTEPMRGRMGPRPGDGRPEHSMPSVYWSL